MKTLFNTLLIGVLIAFLGCNVEPEIVPTPKAVTITKIINDSGKLRITEKEVSERMLMTDFGACAGDFNTDGRVNMADLTVLLDGYGTRYNTSDLTAFLGNLGQEYEVEIVPGVNPFIQDNTYTMEMITFVNCPFRVGSIYMRRFAQPIDSAKFYYRGTGVPDSNRFDLVGESIDGLCFQGYEQGLGCDPGFQPDCNGGPHNLTVHIYAINNWWGRDFVGRAQLVGIPSTIPTCPSFEADNMAVGFFEPFEFLLP